MKSQEKSHGKTVIAFALIAQVSLPPAAFAGGGGCENNPNRMKAAVDITGTGQEKLIKYAYDHERGSINGDLAEYSDQALPVLNPDPVKCGMRNIRRYYKTAAAAENECLGFIPTTDWKKNPGDPRINDPSWGDYKEPLRATAEHPRVSLELSPNPKISCQHDICSIEAPIEKFNLDMDQLKVGSINESCDWFQLRNAKLSIDSANQPKTALIRAKFRYTNNINKPIELISDGTDVVIPVHDLKFSAEGVPAQPAEKPQGGRRAKPMAESLATGGVCNKDAQLELMTPKLIKIASSMITHSQAFMDDWIIGKVKKPLLNGLNNKTIAAFARAQGLGTDKLISAPLPKVTDLTDAKSLDLIAAKQMTMAGTLLDATKSPRLIAKNPEVNLFSGLNALVQEFIDSFSESTSGSSIKTVKDAATRWESVANALSAYPRQTPELQKQTAQLRGYVNEMRNLVTQLQERSAKNKESLDFVATAMRADSLNDDLAVMFNACLKCKTYDFQDPSATASTGFDRSRNYDLAVKVGYGTINQALSFAKDEDRLDFCIVLGVERACSAIQPTDDALRIHFTQPFVIKPGEEPGTVTAKLKSVEIQGQFNIGGTIVKRNIQADLTVHGTLSADNTGKSVTFTGKGKTHLDSMRLSQNSSGQIEKAIGETLAKNEIGSWFLSRFLQKKITKSFPLRGQIQVSGLQFGKDGVAVYTKLPGDPSVLLDDTTTPQKLP